MAKKKKTRKKNGFTIPIAIAAPMGYVGIRTFQEFNNVGATEAMLHLSKSFTGYDFVESKWDWWWMKGGLFPILFGAGAHKVASKLGINRVIAQAGVPWLRI